MRVQNTWSGSGRSLGARHPSKPSAWCRHLLTATSPPLTTRTGWPRVLVSSCSLSAPRPSRLAFTPGTRVSGRTSRAPGFPQTAVSTARDAQQARRASPRLRACSGAARIPTRMGFWRLTRVILRTTHSASPTTASPPRRRRRLPRRRRHLPRRHRLPCRRRPRSPQTRLRLDSCLASQPPRAPITRRRATSRLWRWTTSPCATE